MKTGTRSRPGSTRAVALGVALVLFTQGCTFSLQASSATSLASSAQSSAQSSTNVSVNSSAQSSATLGNGAPSLIIAGAALLVGAAFAVGFAIYGSTRTQSSPPPAPPPPASPRPAAPAPAPAPGAPPPPPPPPPVPGTPAPTNDPNAPLSPPPLVPAAYLDTARQWLAANERQLRQDLALGAGPALDDLAAAAGIRPEHARDFRAVLRRHRADLLARLPASPTVDSAKDFFERVGALTWAEPVLQADARAFLDSLEG